MRLDSLAADPLGRREILPSVKHELDLLGNAVDSLNEGLRRYENAQRNNDVSAYKFVVLHFAHFVELLLKHAVARLHPLLMYRNPASAKLAHEATIGFKEALAILRNAGVTSEQQLIEDLAWLKKLRNDITHYAFTMDVTEVRTTLGRIIVASNALAAAAGVEDLTKDVASDTSTTYRRLREAYEERIAAATAAARSEVGTADRAYDCDLCGEAETAVKRSKMFYCYFCKQGDMIQPCRECNTKQRASHMISISKEPALKDMGSAARYVCWDCEYQINAD